jgi:hypothetical protein
MVQSFWCGAIAIERQCPEALPHKRFNATTGKPEG